MGGKKFPILPTNQFPLSTFTPRDTRKYNQLELYFGSKERQCRGRHEYWMTGSLYHDQKQDQVENNEQWSVSLDGGIWPKERWVYFLLLKFGILFYFSVIQLGMNVFFPIGKNFFEWEIGGNNMENNNIAGKCCTHDTLLLACG